MSDVFDVVVIGGGLVGTSTAFHLAALSNRTVALVERGQICSGGTATSCAIVRTHYSVPSNVALAVHSLKIFDDFPTYLDDPEAESGFVRSGYLILADEGKTSDKLIANMRMQEEFAETHAVSHEEALDLHPMLDLTGIDAVGYEPHSGYADPYLTTSGFERAARRRGVTVMADQQVERLRTDGMRVTGVETNRGVIHAGSVVCAIGPWTRMLTDPLGIETHLEVSRHTVLTLRSDDSYGRLLPVIKDLSTENKMYFRPSTGGVVLVGTGDYGDPIVDPDAMSEALDEDFVLLQGSQITRRMPSFADAALADSWVVPTTSHRTGTRFSARPRVGSNSCSPTASPAMGSSLPRRLARFSPKPCLERRRMSTSPPTTTGALKTAPYSREPTGSDRYPSPV